MLDVGDKRNNNSLVEQNRDIAKKRMFFVTHHKNSATARIKMCPEAITELCLSLQSATESVIFFLSKQKDVLS